MAGRIYSIKFEQLAEPITMKKTPFLFLIVFLSVIVVSCHPDKNNNPGNGAAQLKYSDSVFSLRSTSYTVTPLSGKTGVYSAYPNNLKINTTTGAITVGLNGNDGQSQTGMRYKIKFVSGDITDSTYITIAGVHYFDAFYNLSSGDSLITPYYNGDPSRPLPAGSFSSNGGNKLALKSNGQINIPQTIARGFFNDATNGKWKQVRIDYTTNDNSGISNSIDVILYYYDNMNEVPSNVAGLMQAHQQLVSAAMRVPSVPSTTGAIDNNLSSDLSLAKPRPPCIVIVGH